jgi:hypothetical protein
MTIRCIQIACWVPKATNTLTVCNTHCFSTTTVVAGSLLNATLHVHCLCREMLKFWNKANSRCSVHCFVGLSGED